MKAKKIISIVLVIFWMSIIFYFSSQNGQGSSSTSKSVTNIIINIFTQNKNLNAEEKEKIVLIVEPYMRKLAHFTIYIIGGLLITNLVYIFTTIENKVIVKSSFYGILYAITDEIHQLFVSERSGRVFDVIIDSLGILVGVITFFIVCKIAKKIRCKIKGGK